MRWIVDRAGWYFSLGRPTRNSSAIDSAEEEKSLNYVFQDPTLEADPRSLISVLGAIPDNIVEIIDTAVQACKAHSEFPIVVLSELRLDLIAARSAPFEFIPTRQHLPSVPAENYGRYVRQRWALIMAKWDISNEIVLSSSIDEFLANQIGADIIQQITCEQSKHTKDGQRAY
ncbi:hypothetical protein [Sinorhizobium fredii]|uniref:hypothetical protein n=1 Tax=Rhizobium fredii TaxID=380 RepID=UPI0012959A93|nr:hypothetical protein [Sinorhizobium fredii]MQW95948.1 hypothetical protein [Sinorhizobium fredii]UTY46974.1 hypothetical protein EPK84_09195 [Sinorhizobium fredii]